MNQFPDIHVSTLGLDASVLLEDMKVMYSSVRRRRSALRIEHTISRGVEQLLATLVPGSITLIACRDKTMISEFEFEAVWHIALLNRQPMLIHGSEKSSYQLLRAYLETLDGIEREDSIYDGTLGQRAASSAMSALENLMRSDVRLVATRGSRSESWINLAAQDCEMSAGTRLLHAKGLAQACDELKQLQPTFKSWAARHGNAIIVTCLLDETEVMPFHIVTRQELAMLQSLSDVGFDIQLMGGAADGLRFATPKISPINLEGYSNGNR